MYSQLPQRDSSNHTNNRLDTNKTTFDVRVEPVMLIKFAPASVASAFAKSVFSCSRRPKKQYTFAGLKKGQKWEGNKMPWWACTMLKEKVWNLRQHRRGHLRLPRLVSHGLSNLVVSFKYIWVFSWFHPLRVDMQVCNYCSNLFHWWEVDWMHKYYTSISVA